MWPAIELVPSQQRLVESEALNAKKLTVLLQAVDQRKLRIEDRHSVPVFDGQKMAFWVVPSLREMFRDSGRRLPIWTAIRQNTARIFSSSKIMF